MLLEYLLSNYEHVVSVDSEFRSSDNGERTETVCFAYKDLKTGQEYVCTKPEEILDLPFPHNETVFVCFYATAEADAWINWNIPLPYRIIDLWVETKNLIQDGIKRESGFFGLLETCRRFEIPQKYIMSDEEKEYFRELIVSKSTYTDNEFKSICDYCIKDTVLCDKLLGPVLKHIDLRLKPTPPDIRLHQIFLRGYQKALEAKLYNWGINVDVKNYERFNKYWPKAKDKFLHTKNKLIDVYDDNGTFKKDKFLKLLVRNNLTGKWPVTSKGTYKTDEKTLSKYKHYPDIKLLREIKRLVDSDKLKGYAVGSDGRSRSWVRMFKTITGRCAWSSASYPFGSARWTRSFIKPPKGYMYAYIDWKFQEPCISAYLSKDKNLIEDVQSGDVYLACAKRVRAVPEDATKGTHGTERGIYKRGVLATQYQMGAVSLAHQLKISLKRGRNVHIKIKKAYPTYFNWSNRIVQKLQGRGRVQTLYGWTRHNAVGHYQNLRSLGNWPIQSNGAEMLRAATMEVIHAGLEVHGVIHDALLVLIPLKDHEHWIKLAQQKMKDVAYEITGGSIDTDVEEIRENWWQEKNESKDGPGDLFQEIMELIDEVEKEDVGSDRPMPSVTSTNAGTFS